MYACVYLNLTYMSIRYRTYLIHTYMYSYLFVNVSIGRILAPICVLLSVWYLPLTHIQKCAYVRLAQVLPTKYLGTYVDYTTRSQRTKKLDYAFCTKVQKCISIKQTRLNMNMFCLFRLPSWQVQKSRIVSILLFFSQTIFSSLIK